MRDFSEIPCHLSWHSFNLFYSPSCHLHRHFCHFACIVMFYKHNIPPTWHLRYEVSCSHFDMHGFFFTSNPNRQIIFLAWYVLRDNMLAFQSKSFKNCNNSLKHLLDQPFVAFICNNVSTTCNLLCSFLRPENNGVS
jgi:hypothetical protein